MGVSKARCKMVKKTALRCSKHLLAFFPKVEGQPPRIDGGTGTLVSLGEERFILTASHVVEQFRDKQWHPYVGFSIDGSPAFRLEDCDVRGLSTPHDIALIHLGKEAVDGLKSKDFWSLTQADPLDAVDKATSEYLIFGFPGEWRKVDSASKDAQATFLPLGTVPYTEATGHLEKFNADLHCALLYKKVDVWDDACNLSSVPDPSGISGSAIWRMRNEAEPAEKFSVRNVRLVGVENHFYRDSGAIKGTKIRFVLGLLYQDFPALQSLLIKAFSKDLLESVFPAS